jgi:hypothetical protein
VECHKNDMEINNDKYEKQDINKNCEDSPCKINANANANNNNNNNFLKIAENISDKIVGSHTRTECSWLTLKRPPLY